MSSPWLRAAPSALVSNSLITPPSVEEIALARASHPARGCPNSSAPGAASTAAAATPPVPGSSDEPSADGWSPPSMERTSRQQRAVEHPGLGKFRCGESDGVNEDSRCDPGRPIHGSHETHRLDWGLKRNGIIKIIILIIVFHFEI